MTEPRAPDTPIPADQPSPERRSGEADLVVVGLNHRSSPLALRDRLFVEDQDHRRVLELLRAQGVDQAILLSTCDRIEVQAAARDAEIARAAVIAALGAYAGVPESEIAGFAYRLTGRAALRHIFAVASSLDSQVIGEPQVLGQVKASHRASSEAGLMGPVLDAALQSAYGAAKRVRSETPIGERPVSLATAALEIAREVHGDLAERNGLLIGTGEMGELLAEQLRAAGLGRLVVTAPNPARAEASARAFGCHAAPFAELADRLAAADIVVAALGTRGDVLTRPMVESALRARRRRPVYIVDASIPGDVSPAVRDIEDAFLYTLDDLEAVAMAGRAGREAAADSAWSIVEAEVDAFLRGRAERDAAPGLVALRRHFESVRAAVLAELGSDDAAEATRRLIQRLLHDPSTELRALASDTEPDSRALQEADALLHRLFKLGASQTGGRNEENG